jgi:hypothetical protein
MAQRRQQREARLAQMDAEVAAELAALEAKRTDRGARDVQRLRADNQPVQDPAPTASVVEVLPVATAAAAVAASEPAAAVETVEAPAATAATVEDAGCPLSPSRVPPFLAPSRALLRPATGCVLAAPRARRGAAFAPFPALSAATGTTLGASSAFRAIPSSSSSSSAAAAPTAPAHVQEISMVLPANDDDMPLDADGGGFDDGGFDEGDFDALPDLADGPVQSQSAATDAAAERQRKPAGARAPRPAKRTAGDAVGDAAQRSRQPFEHGDAVLQLLSLRSLSLSCLLGPSRNSNSLSV